MDTAKTYWDDVTILQWQVELGATQAICDAPINRYELSPEILPRVSPSASQAQTSQHSEQTPPVITHTASKDPFQTASQNAQNDASHCQTLDALHQNIQNFQGCVERKGARQCLVSLGPLNAEIMVILEPPGKEEDRQGALLCGPHGDLLSRMFQAIDLVLPSDTAAGQVLCVPALPWRPKRDGEPDPEYMAIMTPFLQAYLRLASPKIIVLMGQTSLRMLTSQRSLRQNRGQWMTLAGHDAIAIDSAATLLKTPRLKREAWHDLLTIRAKLTSLKS